MKNIMFLDGNKCAETIVNFHIKHVCTLHKTQDVRQWKVNSKTQDVRQWKVNSKTQDVRQWKVNSKTQDVRQWKVNSKTQDVRQWKVNSKTQDVRQWKVNSKTQDVRQWKVNSNARCKHIRALNLPVGQYNIRMIGGGGQKVGGWTKKWMEGGRPHKQVGG